MLSILKFDPIYNLKELFCSIVGKCRFSFPDSSVQYIIITTRLSSKFLSTTFESSYETEIHRIFKNGTSKKSI